MAAGFAVDIFACSLDQVGLYEMKVLTEDVQIIGLFVAPWAALVTNLDLW